MSAHVRTTTPTTSPAVAPSPNSTLTLVGMPLICAAAWIESWAAISGAWLYQL